jgi:hypothetical protein
MADQTETTRDAAVEETNGGSKAAVRAAAIAAATGATAYAAKRALNARDQSQSGNREKKPGGEQEESLVATMLASGWDAAKDSLLPFAEDAAATAGEYVARNGPELLRDTLVPRFIRAFEQARSSDESESDESESDES